jgi:hypothetical protein
LKVSGLVESGLSGVEAFKTQVNDLLDDHAVVLGLEKGVDIFEFVGDVVHLIGSIKIIRFICDSFWESLID